MVIFLADEIDDAEQRISLISQAINDLKDQYLKTKNEAASFDRRVKRWKRRVREKGNNACLFFLSCLYRWHTKKLNAFSEYF